MRYSTRQDDEELLSWVATRARGVSVADIAFVAGATVQRVSTATNRVLRDYLGTLPERERTEVQTAHFWEPAKRAAAMQ